MKTTLFSSKSILLACCVAATGIIANAQTVDWAKGMGGNSSDYGYSTTVDDSGNVYVTGYFFSPTAEFNPGGSGGMLTRKAGGYDVFLAKYDAAGGLRWARSMGGNGINGDYGFGVAVDKSGNVYITGMYTSDTADFNPGGSGGKLMNAGGGAHDAFLAKYDAGGGFLWAKSFGGGSNDEGYGVAVDGSGNVYVTGYFNSGTVDFNPGSTGGMLTTMGTEDVFLAKYDAGGNYLWAKNMGGTGADLGYSVAVDGSDNVYVTGYFISGSANFDPGGTGGAGTLTTAGSNDAFLAKYDASGGFLWAKNIGGNSVEWSYDVAVDGSDNVYVTGYSVSATVDFDPGGSGGVVNAAGTAEDVFLAKYDAGGNYLWAKSMGGDEGDVGRSVAVDGRGNVYVTGKFSSATAEFDPGGSGGTLTNASPGGGKGGNTADLFLAKYDSSGNYIWAKAVGGSDEEEGWGNAVDGSGHVYMTGYFSSATVDFDPGGSGVTLNNNAGGSGDVFAVRYACSDTSSSSIAVTLHCGESYTLGDSAYTVSGTYAYAFPNITGCDSTIILDLTVIPLIKPIVNVDEYTLGVPGDYATYQWIKDNTAIPGATDSTYVVTATGNGNYWVVVTNGYGCSDTSDVYPVTNVSVGDIHVAPGQVRLYPNPAGAVVYISSPVKVNVRITDMAGRLIKEQADAVSVPVAELRQGVYLMHVTDEKGVLLKVEKLVKAE